KSQNPYDKFDYAKDYSKSRQVRFKTPCVYDALIARKPSDRPKNCESILKILKELEELEKLAPNAKTNAKRKSFKKAIKESTRKPTSPILLMVSVVVAATLGLGIGTAIKVSALGSFEEINFQLPTLQKKRLTPIRFLQGHLDSIQNVALSPDGKTIASASDDGTVKFWELAGESNSTHEIQDQGGWVRAAIFLSDRQIITAGQDKNIKIIDIASGKVVKTLSGHTNLVNNLAIAPASDLLYQMKKWRSHFFV
ncbi:MAG: WD40 repeat domain-containing protein, partial [Pseudanabaena sp.]